jgi:hypothetical protein
MDIKFIEQPEVDLLSFRLRTARQKKRAQYKDFEKYLLKLHRDEDALDLKKHALGYRPLIPPVQKGWIRSFVLRDDVAESKYAPFFQAILYKINTRQWSPRKDFRIRKRKKGRKIYVVKEQFLDSPYTYKFRRMGFSETEKRYFDEILCYRYSRRLPDMKHVFNEPWRFVLKVQPNMIDQERIVDPELESAIASLRNYLDRNAYKGKQLHLLYGRHRWRYRREGYRYDEAHPFKNMPVYRIIDELRHEGLIRL